MKNIYLLFIYLYEYESIFSPFFRGCLAGLSCFSQLQDWTCTLNVYENWLMSRVNLLQVIVLWSNVSSLHDCQHAETVTSCWTAALKEKCRSSQRILPSNLPSIMADALTTLGTAMFDDVLMAKKAVGISWKVKGSRAHSGIFGIFWRLLSAVVRWHNEPGICVECCRMVYNCRHVTGSNMLIFPSQVKQWRKTIRSVSHSDH